MRMCTFLWVYYGYPTSAYEGANVEDTRYRCGSALAEQEGEGLNVDYVAGVPDSGTAAAIGCANRSGIPFARPLIKYTPTWPRSFTPPDQSLRELIARMKLVPIHSLIEGTRLLLVEDSIVRGTQFRGLTDLLYACGAKELHVRPACPPLLFGCKYLNFTRSKSEDELVTRKVIRELEGEVSEERIAEYAQFGSTCYKRMVESIGTLLNMTSLEFLSLDSMLDSFGIDRCKLCTYCWNGAE
jgi:amidophosphoribosyltransferase